MIRSTACAMSPLWRAVFGVEKTVIERIEFDQDAELLVAHVRPTKRQRSRCGVCRGRSPGYEALHRRGCRAFGASVAG